ncbi:MAG TPA: hypothetical protein DHV62_07190, partial [Elusimicrobia bacterium]|nr:hypothetical protein [Elusimicrobiota bacterium]
MRKKSKIQTKFSLVFLFFLLITNSLIHLFANSLAFGQPQIRLTEVVWNFGVLSEGITAQHKITVKNIGSEELKVNARSSCECLQVQPEKLTIPPKETTDLKVSIYTQGYPGKFGKYIYLDTNDSENAYVTLLVKGEITRIDTNKKRELTRIKERKPIEIQPSAISHQ